MSDDYQPSSADLRQGVFLIVSAMLILPGIDAIAKGAFKHDLGGRSCVDTPCVADDLPAAFCHAGEGLKVRPHFWSLREAF